MHVGRLLLLSFGSLNLPTKKTVPQKSRLQAQEEAPRLPKPPGFFPSRRPTKGSYGFHDGLHNLLWKGVPCPIGPTLLVAGTGPLFQGPERAPSDFEHNKDPQLSCLHANAFRL